MIMGRPFSTLSDMEISDARSALVIGGVRVLGGLGNGWCGGGDHRLSGGPDFYLPRKPREGAKRPHDCHSGRRPFIGVNRYSVLARGLGWQHGINFQKGCGLRRNWFVLALPNDRGGWSHNLRGFQRNVVFASIGDLNVPVQAHASSGVLSEHNGWFGQTSLLSEREVADRQPANARESRDNRRDIADAETLIRHFKPFRAAPTTQEGEAA